MSTIEKQKIGRALLIVSEVLTGLLAVAAVAAFVVFLAGLL